MWRRHQNHAEPGRRLRGVLMLGCCVAVALVSVPVSSVAPHSWVSAVRRLAGAQQPTRRTLRIGSVRKGFSAGGCRRGAALQATVSGLEMRSSLQLVLAQSNASKDLGALNRKLEDSVFEATVLDGQVRVAMDGMQRLRTVDVGDSALQAAGGHEQLAQAVLQALQEAHDRSEAEANPQVWNLFRERTELLKAPLAQIGYGTTPDDYWKEVTSNSNESIKMAEDFFDYFDKDKNGYWSANETAEAQLATEGTEMTEDVFVQLIISVAPDKGRHLTEEDIMLGLSKKMVVDMYTDREMQKKLGYSLDIQKDYDKIFKHDETESEPARAAEDLPASEAAPA